MLRHGKQEGWLQYSPQAFEQWASLNGVNFKHCRLGHVPGRGGALIAESNLSYGDQQESLLQLLTIPRDLILSLERVQAIARQDVSFKEVLDAIGGFGQTARGAILTFLIFVAASSNPDFTSKPGISGSFQPYIKSLPLEDLPTFWSSAELQMLVGTTLAPAISSKLRSLQREWDNVQSCLENITAFRKLGSDLCFDDWRTVDAMYRSRALDFPGIGHCMVPCLDLANHMPHEETKCIYDLTSDGDVALFLRNGKSASQSEEVTITYGDEKGACEMLFSYGFLDHKMDSAEALFLGLAVPPSDTQRDAKIKFCSEVAPGVKITDAGDGEIDWKSDFIWLLCVSDDDGLRFLQAQNLDGTTEAEVYFEDQQLSEGPVQLYRTLAHSELWPVYRLRALTILQQRVYQQMEILSATQDDLEDAEHGEATQIRTEVYKKVMLLRLLEFELLERTHQFLEKEKIELADHEVVQKYLAGVRFNDDDGSQQLAASKESTADEGNRSDSEDFS